MDKTNKIFISSILLCLFMTSCEVEVNHLYIFHTYSDEAIKSVTVSKHEKDLYQLPTPTKEGYTFEGWYFDSKFTIEYSPERVIDYLSLI